jgi:hypothetical protein
VSEGRSTKYSLDQSAIVKDVYVIFKDITTSEPLIGQIVFRAGELSLCANVTWFTACGNTTRTEYIHHLQMLTDDELILYALAGCKIK